MSLVPFCHVTDFAASIAGGMVVDESIMLGLAEAGNLACLKYAIETAGTPVNPEVKRRLARMGHGDAVRYLHATHHTLPYVMMVGAVEGDHTELLDFLWNRCECQFDTCLLHLAAYHGSSGCLSLLHNMGVAWIEDVADTAAARGHLACLQYALMHGCPMSSRAFKRAVRCGRTDTVRYLLENKLIDKEIMIRLPLDYGDDHLECVKMAHEHGCVVDTALLREAVRTLLVPKWRAHVRLARPICLYWCEQAAITSCGPTGAGRKRDRAAFEADFA